MARRGEGTCKRFGCAWLALVFAAATPGQNHGAATPHAPADPNGGAHAATHSPRVALPPLGALTHVELGNAAWVEHRRVRGGAPALPPRPPGAGRYVCAVIACADLDFELTPLLGLARRDVLEIRVPGPFVHAESIALLERMVRNERLSLVLVLGHRECAALAEHAPDDVLRRRLATLRAGAPDERDLTRTLLRRQCELVLAASDSLRDAADHDRLRVLPALVDDLDGRLTCLHQRIDEMPLSPVR